MHKLLIASAVAASLAAPSSAAIVTLTFEGVGNLASVDDFYNGGTDSAGNSGTNYGINFSNTSLGIIDSDDGGTGNIANEPSASTVLFFLSGGAATMNIAAGFTTGFSFFYSSNGTAFVRVYDGLNGTGNVLAQLDLASQFDQNCSGDPGGAYCNWSPIGVLFDGTAYSVDFGGTADRVAFDNVTFGTDRPGGTVPEPATWAMMILGFGLVGVSARRRVARVSA
jgi:hypothetical protein